MTIEELIAHGFKNASVIRGDACINSVKVNNIVEGHPVSFTRRRYSKKVMFTWVHYFHNGAWHSLGDPWQCITPKYSEIAKSILVDIEFRELGVQNA